MTELSPREREIATLAGEGLKNKQIADALFIAEQMVKVTLHNVYAKLPPHRGKFKRMVLVAYARRQGQGGEVA